MLIIYQCREENNEKKIFSTIFLGIKKYLCKMYILSKNNRFTLDNIDIMCYTKLCINCEPKLLVSCFLSFAEVDKKITK